MGTFAKKKYQRYKFKVYPTIEEAYAHECRIWHDFGGPQGILDNEYHPAVPKGKSLKCPVCGVTESYKVEGHPGAENNLRVRETERQRQLLEEIERETYKGKFEIHPILGYIIGIGVLITAFLTLVAPIVVHWYPDFPLRKG